MFGKFLAALAFFSLALATSVKAQVKREHEIRGRNVAFHSPTPRKVSSFEPAAPAVEIVRRMESFIPGRSATITVRESSEVDNAVAFTDDSGGKREFLILYNNAWMQRLVRDLGTEWVRPAILAHEVGHHLAHHMGLDLDDPAEVNHDVELQADWFAGVIMRRLGATLEETLVAFRAIASTAPTLSHPAREMRLGILTTAWNKALLGTPLLDGTGTPRQGPPASTPPKNQ